MSFLVANETGAPPVWVKGMSLLQSLRRGLFYFSFCIYGVKSILKFSLLNYVVLNYKLCAVDYSLNF